MIKVSKLFTGEPSSHSNVPSSRLSLSAMYTSTCASSANSVAKTKENKQTKQNKGKNEAKNNRNRNKKQNKNRKQLKNTKQNKTQTILFKLQI